MPCRDITNRRTPWPLGHRRMRRGNQAQHGHRVGGKKSPTYVSYEAMIARCSYPSHPRYEDYGGRGIQVDPDWRGHGGFERFLAEVGERPEGMTLDRIDCNGHYAPGNVRWADIRTQRWNRRDMIDRAAERDDRVEPLFPVEPEQPLAAAEDWGW